MRITKQELFGMFKRLMRAMGKSVDENYKGMYLDHAACYGGYVIEERDKETTGISHPFGAKRRSTKEMYYSMLMAAQALEILNTNKNES